MHLLWWLVDGAPSTDNIIDEENTWLWLIAVEAATTITSLNGRNNVIERSGPVNMEKHTVKIVTG